MGRVVEHSHGVGAHRDPALTAVTSSGASVRLRRRVDQVRGASRPQLGHLQTGNVWSRGIVRPVLMSCVRMVRVVAYVRVPQRSQSGAASGLGSSSLDMS